MGTRSTMTAAVAALLMAASLDAFASNYWTGEYLVGDIYTYDTPGILAVFLKGRYCPAQKDYYLVDGPRNSNAEQIIAMVMAAKAAGARVNLYTNEEADPMHCFIKGVRVSD